MLPAWRDGYTYGTYSIATVFQSEEREEPWLSRTTLFWDSIGTALKAVQTAAVMEIVHSMMGIVRSPVMTTALQGLSFLFRSYMQSFPGSFSPGDMPIPALMSKTRLESSLWCWGIPGCDWWCLVGLLLKCPAISSISWNCWTFRCLRGCSSSGTTCSWSCTRRALPARFSPFTALFPSSRVRTSSRSLFLTLGTSLSTTTPFRFSTCCCTFLVAFGVLVIRIVGPFMIMNMLNQRRKNVTCWMPGWNIVG